MRNAGLGSWPERRLRISPDRDAIWFEGTTTSHAEFAHRVRRTAAALADGTEAATDEIGEIVIQGPNVMAGYWAEPEQTAAVLQDGWYRSGDAGSLDAEGFLYVRDRYQDMIISGGGERVPGRGGVGVAGVGRGRGGRGDRSPRPTWGEVGLAVVVPSPGTAPDVEQLRVRLRTRLAGFKVPRYVELTDQLPRTATGKIRKPELRARYVTEENPV